MTRRRELADLKGPNLSLRLIRPEDAAFVHGLRTDPTYNRHLSETQGTAEDQSRWIEDYRKREAAGREYYFIVERHDGLRCGTVRLYDIFADHFTWGSWILNDDKPRRAALESAVLSFSFGFRELRCDLAHIDVRVQNTHAANFYRRLGMTETHRTEQDIFFVYTRDRFEADEAGYRAVLKDEAGI